MDAGVDLCGDVLDELVGVGVLHHVERELLVHEAPGRVVVLHAELCAGDAEIGRRQIEQRQRQRLIDQLAREHDGNGCEVWSAAGASACLPSGAGAASAGCGVRCGWLRGAAAAGGLRGRLGAAGAAGWSSARQTDANASRKPAATAARVPRDDTVGFIVSRSSAGGFPTGQNLDMHVERSLAFLLLSICYFVAVKGYWRGPMSRVLRPQLADL